jgi:TatD DNase family protein
MLIRWQNKLKENGKFLANRAGVLHSFSGTLNQAQQLVKNGFYISISGPVTYKKADELRQVAASVPIDKVLIETDAPYLTPHPFRGQRNEPSFVKYVAEKIAEVRNMPVEEVANITSENAANLFRW